MYMPSKSSEKLVEDNEWWSMLGMRAGVGEFRLADSDAVRLKQQLEALELAKATSIEKQVKLSQGNLN